MTKKAARILLVDDDADFRDSTRLMLESKGYSVFEAANSDVGLRLAKAVNPDAILIDIVMDTYSEGFSFIQQLASDDRTEFIPRVIVTNFSLVEGDDGVLPEELGTSAVLKKPLSTDQLTEAIRKSMQERR